MSAVLAYLGAIFGPLIQSVGGRLSAAFTTAVNILAQGEKQDLHDAIDKYQADRTAGKTHGESAADALDVFYTESKGTVGTAGHSFFQGFLKSMEGQ